MNNFRLTEEVRFRLGRLLRSGNQALGDAMSETYRPMVTLVAEDSKWIFSAEDAFAPVAEALLALDAERKLMVRQERPVDGGPFQSSYIRSSDRLANLVHRREIRIRPGDGSCLRLGVDLTGQYPWPRVLVGEYQPARGTAEKVEWKLDAIGLPERKAAIEAGLNWFVGHLGEFCLNPGRLPTVNLAAKAEKGLA